MFNSSTHPCPAPPQRQTTKKNVRYQSRDIKGVIRLMVLFFFFFFLIIIYLFMAVLGLRFCARAFFSC